LGRNEAQIKTRERRGESTAMVEGGRRSKIELIGSGSSLKKAGEREQFWRFRERG